MRRKTSTVLVSTTMVGDLRAYPDVFSLVLLFLRRRVLNWTELVLDFGLGPGVILDLHWSEVRRGGWARHGRRPLEATWAAPTWSLHGWRPLGYPGRRPFGPLGGAPFEDGLGLCFGLPLDSLVDPSVLGLLFGLSRLIFIGLGLVKFGLII